MPSRAIQRLKPQHIQSLLDQSEIKKKDKIRKMLTILVRSSYSVMICMAIEARALLMTYFSYCCKALYLILNCYSELFILSLGMFMSRRNMTVSLVSLINFCALA